MVNRHASLLNIAVNIRRGLDVKQVDKQLSFHKFYIDYWVNRLSKKIQPKSFI